MSLQDRRDQREQSASSHPLPASQMPYLAPQLSTGGSAQPSYCSFPHVSWDQWGQELPAELPSEAVSEKECTGVDVHKQASEDDGARVPATPPADEVLIDTSEQALETMEAIQEGSHPAGQPTPSNSGVPSTVTLSVQAMPPPLQRHPHVSSVCYDKYGVWSTGRHWYFEDDRSPYFCDNPGPHVHCVAAGLRAPSIHSFPHVSQLENMRRQFYLCDTVRTDLNQYGELVANSSLPIYPPRLVPLHLCDDAPSLQSTAPPALSVSAVMTVAEIKPPEEDDNSKDIG